MSMAGDVLKTMRIGEVLDKQPEPQEDAWAWLNDDAKSRAGLEMSLLPPAIAAALGYNVAKTQYER